MGLKVAMVSPFFVRCGVASYSMALSKALANLGCEVFGVRLPRFGAKTSEILQNVVSKIPTDKIDVIHIQGEYGLYQGFEGHFYAGLKQLGKPVVTTMHAVSKFQIDRVVADVSDKVIVHNKFCARNFGFPEKTVIVPHGASLTMCPPKEECRRCFGVPVKAPIVGYCGFISAYKGLETLISAMVKIPEAALLIAGGWHTEGAASTKYIAELKQRTSQLLPRRCQWLGYVPDEKLAKAYGAMDVLCYCSRFATESGALIMGLAHGRPTIASNLPPFREKEKQGALITFKDVKDLRRKIKRLLKDDDLRMKLTEGARKYAESVKWYPTIAEKHIKLYEDVVKRHGETTKR